MSKTWDAIKIVFDRGYWCDPVLGIVYDPQGQPLHCGLDGFGYFVKSFFGSPFSRKGRCIAIHSMVAYCVFGDSEIPSRRLHVRHLDGDPKNNRMDNLALGSARENALDIPRGTREAIAKERDRVLGFVGCSSRSLKGHESRRKLTPKIREEIRSRFHSGESGPALARQFGVSKSTVSRIAA